MSHSSKKIVASKASIHADEFTRPGKIRQTSAHHAFKTTARGDVKVIIKEQYPRQDTDSERPPKGTVIKGDSAEISSMTFDMTISICRRYLVRGFIGSLIPNPTTRCFITYRFMEHSVKAHRKPNVIKMASRHAMMFPFAAIVGQDLMKKALILNVIDPGIGGVLIKGEKGTAKSTTIRSLEQVLPKKEVVKGCPFHCDPRRPEGFCPYCAEKAAAGEKLETETVPTDVIELPLSATEDRVAGTLDLEAVLQTGKKKFEPGILAQANGNLLYVDEINLLEDYIVDMLLDSAAMGTNYVEREGVSFTHPARFVLVGSMNPEEGDLRPQLLDRFGMSVEVKGERDLAQRSEVVSRRLQFAQDTNTFTASYEEETARIRDGIANARALIKDIEVDRKIIDAAAYLSVYFGMEGHRADITMIRSARANAAYEGRRQVTKADLEAVASLVLGHRLKKKPFEKTSDYDLDDVHRCLEEI